MRSGPAGANAGPRGALAVSTRGSCGSSTTCDGAGSSRRLSGCAAGHGQNFPGGSAGVEKRPRLGPPRRCRKTTSTKSRIGRFRTTVGRMGRRGGVRHHNRRRRIALFALALPALPQPFCSASIGRTFDHQFFRLRVVNVAVSFGQFGQCDVVGPNDLFHEFLVRLRRAVLHGLE